MSEGGWPDPVRLRSWVLAGAGLLAPVALWVVVILTGRAGLAMLSHWLLALLLLSALVGAAFTVAAVACSLAALLRLDARPAIWRYLEPLALPMPYVALAIYVVEKLAGAGY